MIESTLVGLLKFIIDHMLPKTTKIEPAHIDALIDALDTIVQDLEA